MPARELEKIASQFSEKLLFNKLYTFKTPEGNNEVYSKFFQSDLIQVTANGSFKFTHSILISYFASLISRASLESQITENKFRWSTFNNYLAFLSTKDQEPAWISTLTSEFSPYFPSNTLLIGDWLKFSNQNLNWKDSLPTPSKSN